MNNVIRKINWTITILVLIVITLFVLTTRIHANEDCWKNCWQPTITPTPTIHLCFTGDEEVPHPCMSPTPTVTPIPTATPSATPTSTSTPSMGGSSGGSGGNNAPPVAQCGTPFDIPMIVGFIDKGNGTVNFAWTEGQTVDKYSITYGLSPDNLNMGEDNIPGNVTNLDIHDLPVGSHVWAQIQAWFNGCEESSNVFDPIVK